MARIIGPDFIGIQVEDLDAARAFYEDVLGLKVMPGPPGAVVFDTRPIPFAVRTPLDPLPGPEGRGKGVALWFACDDAEALHDDLKARGIPIIFDPKDGPFGRYFSFLDPFGYAITAHTAKS